MKSGSILCASDSPVMTCASLSSSAEARPVLFSLNMSRTAFEALLPEERFDSLFQRSTPEDGNMHISASARRSSGTNAFFKNTLFLKVIPTPAMRKCATMNHPVEAQVSELSDSPPGKPRGMRSSACVFMAWKPASRIMRTEH